MNFTFRDTMSDDVLRSYLSRAVTQTGLVATNEGGDLPLEDDLRMLTREGAKFIGRAAFVWGEAVEEEHFARVRSRAAECHSADPEFILQCCVFECVTRTHSESVPIPAWVFEAFGRKPETRNFLFDAMSFSDGKFANQWGKQTTVPDITTLEGQMWIYYRACRYIACGCEAIHFGQVWLIGANDKGWRQWDRIVKMIRGYAKTHARRGYVVCDAHCHGLINEEAQSILDFNSFPIRLKEVENEPQHCVCEALYSDSLFGRNTGGVPFLVEFDNFGISKTPGKLMPDTIYAWGYDEISWFALQPPEYRAQFLAYIHDWVHSNYPDGYVQMPSHRILTVPGGRSHYAANAGIGWNDEEAIARIWHRL